MHTEMSLSFDRQTGKLFIDDKAVVNLSSIPSNARATIYSSLTTDAYGMEVDFRIDESKKPFRIDSTALSIKGFLRAVMENRLEVQGMVVDDSITEVYRALCLNNMEC